MNQKTTISLLTRAFSFFIALAISYLTSCNVVMAQVAPSQVSVLPVFVVPKGEQRPSRSDKALLIKHLRWAQTRYRVMLDNRSTFDFEIKPKVFQSKRSLKQFKDDGNAADLIVEELLESWKMNRFSCEYIFLAVFVNPEEKFPGGGGRPFNGGFNTGGGIVVISTSALKSKNFQSTLQHELGHSFGLLHVDAYGYNMKRNDSIMSYNKSHHTNYLKASETPGILIPEDIRGLALNDRVFKDLTFKEKRDLPRRYELKEIRHLGPMKLPQQPLVKVESLTEKLSRPR